MTSRLAIDVMSGDYGSSVIIEGLVEAIRIYPEPFIVHLCGNKEKIRTDLKNAGIEEKDYGEKFVLEHCTDIVDMDRRTTISGKGLEKKEQLVNCQVYCSTG